jgi:hypothetical protein
MPPSYDSELQGGHMQVKALLTAGGLLVFGAFLGAITINSTKALVVSVDAAAKTIALKHRTEDAKQWVESTVVWDESTQWSRAEVHIWEETPAKADLAKALKKDDKVYVRFRDEGDKRLHLEKLKTIPASEKVE